MRKLIILIVTTLGSSGLLACSNNDDQYLTEAIEEDYTITNGPYTTTATDAASREQAETETIVREKEQSTKEAETTFQR